MNTTSKAFYADDRAYLKGIRDIMTRTESELVARLDELREQMSYIDHAMSALSVYEHISSSNESEVPHA